MLRPTCFDNDVENGLLAYLDPVAMAFRSTYQDYKTSGFELQARAAITHDLTLMGGLGYIDSSLGANGAGLTSIDGNRLPNTPKWNLNAGLQYERSADVVGLTGDFAASLQYQYTSKRAADVNGSFDLDDYHIVNARLGWKSGADGVEIYAFGRNLLDERYEVFGAASFGGAQVVTVGDGRVLGVSKSF